MDYLKIWMVKIMTKKIKNKNDEIFRKYAFDQAGMLVQFILVFFLLLFIVLTVFHPSLKLASQIILILTLLVMAYNNHRIYKRKAFTILYIVVAIFVLLSILLVG